MAIRIKTAEQWNRAIEHACAEPDPILSNQLITTLHYLLSEALAEAVGRECGPNFHTWAVWGSRKAGVTIRQEDLGSAIRNATLTAGVVGALIGAVAGALIGHSVGWNNAYQAGFAGSIGGGVIGAWTGRLLAIWSRAKAAKLVLRGNQVVIRDIGKQSARFLELIGNGALVRDREIFFAGLQNGPTEFHGQDRLITAYRSYLAALDCADLESKSAAMIAGNCEIVYHEHIQLEPFIRSAMPFIVRRCATQRLMSYEVGERVLAVKDDIPGSVARTAARDWTNIEERMRYVFALFRSYHNLPDVFSPPFPHMENESLESWTCSRASGS